MISVIKVRTGSDLVNVLCGRGSIFIIHPVLINKLR